MDDSLRMLKSILYSQGLNAETTMKTPAGWLAYFKSLAGDKPAPRAPRFDFWDVVNLYVREGHAKAAAIRKAQDVFPDLIVTGEPPRTFSAPAPRGGPGSAGRPASFEEAVHQNMVAGMKRSDAIRLAVGEYEDLHEQFLQRQRGAR